VAARASRVIYLMDGNIHDELILGTYTGSDSEHSNHEKALFQWLEKHGF
jgi:putative ABC transport system ATP-binding protein